MSLSSHLPRSISFPLCPSSPWPVKIHTGIQPCGKSDKTSVELHRLGGMYVANDFQRLMMRKEVENWCGGGGRQREGRTLNRESMKLWWMFWLKWRLLIKAKYRSFSSLFSPPPWFSSLYCWPPDQERVQSLNGRTVNKERECWNSLCGWSWMRVFIYCVYFLDRPHHILFGFQPNSVHVLSLHLCYIT